MLKTLTLLTILCVILIGLPASAEGYKPTLCGAHYLTFDGYSSTGRYKSYVTVRKADVLAVLQADNLPKPTLTLRTYTDPPILPMQLYSNQQAQEIIDCLD